MSAATARGEEEKKKGRGRGKKTKESCRPSRPFIGRIWLREEKIHLQAWPAFKEEGKEKKKEKGKKKEGKAVSAYSKLPSETETREQNALISLSLPSSQRFFFFSAGNYQKKRKGGGGRKGGCMA